MRQELPAGYEIREMPTDVFGPLWVTHAQKMFEETSLIVSSPTLLSQQEQEALKPLRERTQTSFRVNYGVFYNEEFVGWSWGRQVQSDEFYMVNSAVLAEHRGRGLYTALMHTVLERCRSEGFQIVYSRHHANNNQVIVPKLRAGFVISGLEQSDIMGTLVWLKYYFNETRKKLSEFRCGYRRPDKETLKALGL